MFLHVSVAAKSRIWVEVTPTNESNCAAAAVPVLAGPAYTPGSVCQATAACEGGAALQQPTVTRADALRQTRLNHIGLDKTDMDLT
jgi:hypothetical protein